jgi:hypothetical protein
MVRLGSIHVYNMTDTYDPSLGNQPTRRPGGGEPPSMGDQTTMTGKGRKR